LGRCAFAIRCHLRLDIHTLVEFHFCNPSIALRVSLFFDGVEDTTEFGEPL
jgi:hypothetical protein